jgi:hypothetical protein
MEAKTVRSTIVVAEKAVPVASANRLSTLRESLSNARNKIREDVLRFRTCCADPRASK